MMKPFPIRGVSGGLRLSPLSISIIHLVMLLKDKLTSFSRKMTFYLRDAFTRGLHHKAALQKPRCQTKLHK